MVQHKRLHYPVLSCRKKELRVFVLTTCPGSITCCRQRAACRNSEASCAAARDAIGGKARRCCCCACCKSVHAEHQRHRCEQLHLKRPHRYGLRALAALYGARHARGEGPRPADRQARSPLYVVRSQRRQRTGLAWSSRRGAIPRLGPAPPARVARARGGVDGGGARGRARRPRVRASVRELERTNAGSIERRPARGADSRPEPLVRTRLANNCALVSRRKFCRVVSALRGSLRVLQICRR